MDPGFVEYFGLMNGISCQSLDDSRVPVLSNHTSFVAGFPNLRNGYVSNYENNNVREFSNSYTTPCDVYPSGLSSVSANTQMDNLHEDYDFSDSVLRYINQILMEEDVEGRSCMLQESLGHHALQEAENSLHEVIRDPSLPEHDLGWNPSLNLNLNPPYDCPNFENLDCYPESYFGHRNDDGGLKGLLGDPVWVCGTGGVSASDLENNGPISHQSSMSSYSSNGSMNNVVISGLVDSPVSTLSVPDLYNESQSISQFRKGVEEASKFLLDSSQLVISADSTGLPSKSDEKSDIPLVSSVLKENGGDSCGGTRARKHPFGDDEDLEEERSTKQAAKGDDSEIRSDMFDKVLLYHAGDKNELISSLRTTLQTAATQKTQPNGQSKGSTASKGRGKRQGQRKEVVDLRTLLMSCAQAVAADDRRTAGELLKQIRQHSSQHGDGNQRLAHYLADGLEARLAGTGSRIYKALTNQRTTASDVLKAYLLYLAACPFRKLSNFFSNKNIAKLTRKAARIHIIDFGILYGFQWPTFIQRQSMREGGPPKIRMTGIDFPQPGFRPAERVEETGRRLENYAQEFDVPFEYRAIAKRWDTIKLEDFDIDEDEVLIVNCTYRMKNLPDETVSAESSRNSVLKMIRKLNPDLFIHGVVNGAYNAPFFVTRFREALFHFSAQFDMLETIVPRESDERMLIEKDLLAREALNVIACEGWERVERPETYRQWQVRTMRAGFTQLPLDAEIMERAMSHVNLNYHKDFVIDQDSRWLLLGWKGRIIFALSTWQPT